MVKDIMKKNLNNINDLISIIQTSISECMMPGNEQCKSGTQNAAVLCNITLGILPRFFKYETLGRSGEKLIVIVGHSPSPAANSGEYKALESQSPEEAWEKSNNIFPKQIDQKNYGIPIKEFLQKVNENGPILWTEFRKCQTVPNADIDLLTNNGRKCADIHLKKELLFAKGVDALIIALGSQTFHDIRQLELGVRLIGIPHPSQSGPYNLSAALNVPQFIKYSMFGINNLAKSSRIKICKNKQIKIECFNVI
jgi:hypothetical protein